LNTDNVNLKGIWELSSNRSKIFVLHENSVWVEPLAAAFLDLGLEFEEWFLNEGTLDLTSCPPLGVFYNRTSASAHTRGHRYAPEYTSLVLDWLESHGRTVINGSRALHLELSKVSQYTALAKFGVRTPETFAVAVGPDGQSTAARVMKVAGSQFADEPFILKPNRGGRGVGVQLFQNSVAAYDYIIDGKSAAPLDGIWLVQKYVRAPDKHIIRSEFVAGEFLYAVRVDASKGFELCPADACQVDNEAVGSRFMFDIIEDFHHPVLDRYRACLAMNDIQIAGVEMLIDGDGEAWTYDINTNTNYNQEAEAVSGYTGTSRAGMHAIAEYLGKQLDAVEELTKIA
jgi:hypothetical protein